MQLISITTFLKPHKYIVCVSVVILVGETSETKSFVQISHTQTHGAVIFIGRRKGGADPKKKKKIFGVCGTTNKNTVHRMGTF